MIDNEQAYQEGLARFGQGDLEAALACFEKVDQGNSKLHAQAMSYIGRIQTLQGDYDQAENSLRSSLTMQIVVEPQSLFFLAECLFFQRKWAETEKTLKETIAREPKYTDAHIRLGMVLKEQRRLPEAIRSFELAIVNDQKAVVARYQLALICVETEDHKRALSQLHLVKSLAPNYGPAFVLQGDIFQRIGDHRQAIVEYVKVVDLGKGDAALYWRMGRSFMAIKDRKQAVRAFEEAARLDSRMWPAFYYAAQLRDEFQHFDKALQHYRALLDSEEYQAMAKEAVDRLTKQLASFDLGSRKATVEEEDVTFSAPPVTTKVDATHSLVQMQRQLTNQLGPARTAPMNLPAKTEKGPPPNWNNATPPQTRTSEVLGKVITAVRAGAFNEAVGALKSLSVEDLTGSLRGRVEPMLSEIPGLKNVLDLAKRRLSKK